MKRLIPLVLIAALTGAAMAGVTVLLLGGSPGTTTTTVSASATGASASGARREVSSSSTTSSLTATQIYRRDSSGVVAIRAVTASGEDTGTGIVLDDSGLILTNNHVVNEASSIAVSPGEVRRQDTHGDARRRRPRQRPRADQDRPVRPRPQTADARRLEHRPDRRFGLRDRQPLRARRDPDPWHRLCAGPRNQSTRRRHDHRRHPDRRRTEPRQLRRSTAQHRGRSHRDQLADRQRSKRHDGLPARQHRRRLRDLLGYRQAGRQDDRSRRERHDERHRNHERRSRTHAHRDEPLRRKQRKPVWRSRRGRRRRFRRRRRTRWQPGPRSRRLRVRRRRVDRAGTRPTEIAP